MSGPPGGTPPRRDARTLFPINKSPDQLRAELKEAEQATRDRDAGDNVARERRLKFLTEMTLDDVLEREIKTMLTLPIGVEPGTHIRVSERTALITAGVKLLAVKARMTPLTGEGLDDDDE